MIVVPVKAKIYIFKVFYMDFLLPITSIIQTKHTLYHQSGDKSKVIAKMVIALFWCEC